MLLYDTQQVAPFAMLNNLHYAPLSDLAWAADGRILAISSEDGYVSIVSFKEVSLKNDIKRIWVHAHRGAGVPCFNPALYVPTVL